jgi:retinol dehydrogenase 12
MGERDLEGKVHVITGANTGIGRATAEALVRRGGHVVFAGRSEERTRPVMDALASEGAGDRIGFGELKLDDLSSVRRCGAELADRGPIHVLVNNAGLAGSRGVTADGFEVTFGVNHLGHFLLTQLLLGTLRASAPARIVNVSSHSHYRARAIDWDALRRPTASFTGIPEYEVSKLANVLFTAELARRLEGTGVTSYAVHPGVIASDIWKRIPPPFRGLAKLFMKSNQEGARTSVHCASSPEVAGDSGLYYAESRPKKPSKLAQDPDLAAELWRRSEEWCGLSLAGEARGAEEARP